jgi:hypothetical protein
MFYFGRVRTGSKDSVPLIQIWPYYCSPPQIHPAPTKTKTSVIDECTTFTAFRRCSTRSINCTDYCATEVGFETLNSVFGYEPGQKVHDLTGSREAGRRLPECRKVEVYSHACRFRKLPKIIRTALSVIS